jgi:hypothetical protein
MFKNISRQLQKKVDCKIIFEIKKISVHLDESAKVQVIWKRGPEEQEGQLCDFDPYTTEVETTDRFVKVSSFYSRDERITHEPKMCEILLQSIDEDGEKSIIARLEYNMAPFVKITKTEVPDKVVFKDSKFGDTYIDVVWTIFADSQLLKSQSTLGSEVYTQTEIKAFIQQAGKLEEQNDDFQQKIDMANNIKKGV